MATLADLLRRGNSAGGMMTTTASGPFSGAPRMPTRPNALPGSLPATGAQPWPSNSTTGGVGTTMQPNATNTGGLEPAPYGGMGNPAPTNGPRLPPIPADAHPMLADNWGWLHSQPSAPRAGTPEWYSSPQGLNAQKEMAMRLGNSVLPGSMNGSHFTGQHQTARPDPRANSGEGYVSPYAASKGAQSAQSQANWANPDWRMQQVLAGRIAPTNNAELQAMLANMAPADRDAYLAKYRSIGLDPTYQGGGGTGPFGN